MIDWPIFTGTLCVRTVVGVKPLSRYLHIFHARSLQLITYIRAPSPGSPSLWADHVAARYLQQHHNVTEESFLSIPSLFVPLYMLGKRETKTEF